MAKKTESKIIELEQRDSFVHVIMDYKGIRYEGLLLKSNKDDKKIQTKSS